MSTSAKILVSLLLTVGLAAGGYYGYSQYQQQEKAKEQYQQNLNAKTQAIQILTKGIAALKQFKENNEKIDWIQSMPFISNLFNPNTIEEEKDRLTKIQTGDINNPQIQFLVNEVNTKYPPYNQFIEQMNRKIDEVQSKKETYASESKCETLPNSTRRCMDAQASVFLNDYIIGLNQLAAKNIIAKPTPSFCDEATAKKIQEENKQYYTTYIQAATEYKQKLSETTWLTNRQDLIEQTDKGLNEIQFLQFAFNNNSTPTVQFECRNYQEQNTLLPARIAITKDTMNSLTNVSNYATQGKIASCKDNNKAACDAFLTLFENNYQIKQIRYENNPQRLQAQEEMKQIIQALKKQNNGENVPGLTVEKDSNHPNITTVNYHPPKEQTTTQGPTNGDAFAKDLNQRVKNINQAKTVQDQNQQMESLKQMLKQNEEKVLAEEKQKTQPATTPNPTQP